MTLRFGILGTGRMAATMTRALAAAPGVELVAVASASGDRARAFAAAFGLARGHEGLDALLADPAVDAVYVANATPRHARAAVRSLEAGKPVLCEKPFAATLEEGREAAAAARASGLTFMEAVFTQFLPAVTRFVELARAAPLGPPRHLRFEFGHPASPEARPDLFAGPGAGALLDRGVYGATLAVRLFGPAERVQSLLRRGPDGTDLTASLQIEHAGGAHSQIVCSVEALCGNGAALSCAGGVLSLAPSAILPEAVLTRAEAPAGGGEDAARPPGAAARLRGRLRASPSLRRLASRLPRGGREALGWGGDPYRFEIEHFRDLVARGRPESDVMPLTRSLEVLRVIDAARASGPVPAFEGESRS